MEYVDRLSKYTPTTTAEAAVTKGLFEVAFIVYKKAKLHVEAIGVLVDKIGDLVRAQEVPHSFPIAVLMIDQTVCRCRK